MRDERKTDIIFNRNGKSNPRWQNFKGKKLYKSSLAYRLGKAIIVNKQTGCWEWQQSKNHDGYGTITVNGKTKLAHRISYEIVIGNIPPNKLICHDCDNPACINPEHLFVGMQFDNMQDCAKKNRTNPPIVSFPGELNPRHKLNNKKVKKIKSLFGKMTQQRIADLFNVSQSQVNNILRGKEWKDL